MVRLAALATDYRRRFEKKTRTNGDEFWAVKDGEQTEELQDLCHAAHGDMFPDDWKYEFITDALDALEDADDRDEARESLHEYVYTGDQLKWLASSNSRPYYCDEAAEEFGFVLGTTGNTLGLISHGLRKEQEEVFESVCSGLEEIIETAGFDPWEELPEGTEAWDAPEPADEDEESPEEAPEEA